MGIALFKGGWGPLSSLSTKQFFLHRNVLEFCLNQLKCSATQSSTIIFLFAT